MKKITKKDPPKLFLEWRDKGEPDWDPSYNNLAGEPKKSLHASLLYEQGFICCYCGIAINRDDSHIEHLVPQQKNPSLSLDYDNLLASCLRRTEKNQPLHCGALKGDWYDPSLMVSPLDNNCERRFAFDMSGAISANDVEDKGAIETIYRLGLNIDKMISFRRKAIEGYLEILDSLSDADIRKLISSLDHRNADDSFVPFCFAIAYVLKSLV